MPDSFQYDVFLSHSSKDKAVVRELGEQLKRDGLRVWFADWEVRPGDMILKKVEEGLEGYPHVRAKRCGCGCHWLGQPAQQTVKPS